MDSSELASRRTRSQVAPKWTGKEALVLINEIAAEETYCSDALSSYQKWELISENCNALDVPRTSNQCKRKWDSLLEDYHKIKKWESSNGDSYWSLSIEKRKRLKLPTDLSNELFEAINAVVEVQEDKAGTESYSDPEAEADTDMLEVIPKPGLKISRQRPSSQNNEKRPQEQQQAAKSKKIHVGEKLLETSTDEEEVKSSAEDADAVAAKLRHNAELIHEIVNESLAEECETENAPLGTTEDSQTEFVRRQGDRLITCFGEFVNTFHRLSELAKGWE